MRASLVYSLWAMQRAVSPAAQLSVAVGDSMQYFASTLHQRV